MASSLNRVSLIGNLAAAPEKRSTKAGKIVCSFPLAVNRRTKLPDGQKGESTDYHRITAWAKLGETAAQYFTKGKRVMVEGSLRNRSYEDKEGKKRYATEVVMSNFYFMDGKAKSAEKATA
ncbi:MAG: single-stranded DNA-binding protein [Patescibacteria group bacterium]